MMVGFTDLSMTKIWVNIMWKLDFDFGHLKFEKLGSENTMKVAGYSGLELRSKFYTKSKNL